MAKDQGGHRNLERFNQHLGEGPVVLKLDTLGRSYYD